MVPVSLGNRTLRPSFRKKMSYDVVNEFTSYKQIIRCLALADYSIKQGQSFCIVHKIAYHSHQAED